MTSRRRARRTAIDILYQADITDADPTLVLAEWIDAGRPVSTFSAELVEGVERHLPEIDLLLEEHTEGWTVARMAALDRTILRVAVHELHHRPDIPSSVAISENRFIQLLSLKLPCSYRICFATMTASSASSSTEKRPRATSGVPMSAS